MRLNIVPSIRRQTATLFFFHGSGSSADEMKQWIDIMNRGTLTFPHIKIVYPSAPAQPYTAINGLMQNVWFNRASLSIDAPEQSESVKSMCREISELIKREVEEHKIGLDRIAVAGFSMGGELALHLAYRFLPSIAGCVAMSSFLVRDSSIYKELENQEDKRYPPLLLFHGMKDDLIPFQRGEELYDRMKKLGVDTTFIPLPGVDHELSREEVERFKKFILDILPEGK